MNKKLQMGLFLLSVLATSVFANAESRVQCSEVQSKLMHRAVAYCAILPPSYDKQTSRKFPVVYFLHGLGDNEQSLVNSGGWNIYDNLVREKKVREYVIIVPAGYRSFYVDAANGKLPYEQFFFSEFMPAMELKYRIGTTRAERGLIGVSMGGFGALHYAFAHPDKFAAVSVHMAALIDELPASFNSNAEQRIMEAAFGNPPDRAHYRSVSPISEAQTAPKVSLQRLKIYFDCGSDDTYNFEIGTQALHKVLEKRGIAHEYHIYPGSHSIAYVKQHFPASLEFQSKALGAK